MQWHAQGALTKWHAQKAMTQRHAQKAMTQRHAQKATMKWTALMAITGVLAFGPTYAEEKKPQTSQEVEQVFSALDRDDDKRISKQEAQRRAELKERFEGVDASGDGYLSRNEYRARPSDEPFE